MFFLSLAKLESEDPRFAWVHRDRADVDLAAYGRGRVNLLIDTELVMGNERRSFDLNQANVMFEASGSWRAGPIEIAGVAHHVSRHVVDREFDRVPAWHTIGVRGVGLVSGPRASAAFGFEYGHVVQHTFVDYSWTSQLTIRFERTFESDARLFASGSAGLVGVDPSVLHRDSQSGGRVEGGMRLPPRRAALEIYAAWERRVDAYPTSRQPGSWAEFGARIATP